MTPQRGSVRPAVLAGRWYPGNASALERTVAGYLADAPPPPRELRAVSAIVAPHAGYVYSGPTAGAAWSAARGHYRRVVLVGPAHRVPFRGIALGDYGGWEVPNGTVWVDRTALAAIEAAGLGGWVPEAHVVEHCLEIQLPFLLETLGPDVPIVPLLCGWVSHEAAVQALALILRDGDLLVLSSDLSHYEAYDSARTHDRRTLDRIMRLDGAVLDGGDACGHRGVGAGCAIAATRGWRAVLLDYKSSGDTAGDKETVVGYGAVALGPPV